jgi:EpsI family protein
MKWDRSAWLRFAIVAALLAATALFLRARGNAEIVPPAEPLSSFPPQIARWQGATEAISQSVLEVLGSGEFLERIYSRSPDEPPVDLFIAYFPSQRNGSSIHSPQNCLPGSGWSPIQLARVELPGLNQTPMKVNRYVLAKDSDRLLVYYWYQEHGRAVASEYWAKFYLVADAIRIHRSDAALVRVMTPVASENGPANPISLTSADQRSMEFIQNLLPLLGRFIPN